MSRKNMTLPILWFLWGAPDHASWSWRTWTGRWSCRPTTPQRQNRQVRFRSTASVI